MNVKIEKIFSSPIIGMPLLYLGVALMLVHFALNYALAFSSNIILVLAFILEIIGVASHYYKLKH